MATNWQPPFGLPFPPFPPPQQQSQAQSNAQGAPSDAYQPPPANSVPPPAWNAATIPGLNLQAHNQNAQQPQFPSGKLEHVISECCVQLSLRLTFGQSVAFVVEITNAA